MLEELRVRPHTKKKGKIMKVQALKGLVLSVLWADTLHEHLSFLAQWNPGVFS